MKFYLSLITIFLTFSVNSATLKKVWESKQVFKTPESVNYYKDDNCLLISNINGNPTDKDGNGFISKIKTDGTIIKLKWIEGLNAPKGAAIFNNKMVVTDIDRIAVIDLKKGKILKFINIPGSSFLNDVAVDSNGIFYISDSSKNSKIYAFNGEKTYVFLSKPAVNMPNGLFIKKNKLFIGNSGDGIIKKVNLKTKKIKNFIKVGNGIDGLKFIKPGCFLTTDWSGHITLAFKKQENQLLLDTTDKKINAADVEYIKSKKLLIVPTFFDNRCVGYKLEQK